MEPAALSNAILILFCINFLGTLRVTHSKMEPAALSNAILILICIGFLGTLRVKHSKMEPARLSNAIWARFIFPPGPYFLSTALKISYLKISNVGYLLVRPQVLPEGSPLVNALPISNASSAGIGRMDVGPMDRVWIGGAERRPPQLLSRQFGLVGCLHHVLLDGRPIGLWNFRSQSDTCTACIEGAILAPPALKGKDLRVILAPPALKDLRSILAPPALKGKDLRVILAPPALNGKDLRVDYGTLDLRAILAPPALKGKDLRVILAPPALKGKDLRVVLAPPALKGKMLCLHHVLLDGRPIGLWNFRSQSDTCTACIEAYNDPSELLHSSQNHSDANIPFWQPLILLRAEEVQEEQAYRFSGDGYSVLHHDSIGTYNKYLFSVSLSFRSFDENAILFLATGHQTGRFVSLVLHQGHVVFRIGYGGDASLEISTNSRYNTGNWTRLEATRYFDRKKKVERGILKVESESRDGAPTPPPSQEDIPDLLKAQYYLGGVPPGFSASVALPSSFLGCMADINVAQEGYNPMRGKFWGVQSGCSNKPLTVVGFHGDGYLELQSHTLKKKASFGFVFATKQGDALLMLSTLEGFTSSGDANEDNEEATNLIDQENRQSYYSVSLRRGQIDVRINAGRGEVRLASDSSEYGDGLYHSILISKFGRRLELRVDDVVHSLASLPEGSSMVKAPGQYGGLFFGGLPFDINTTGRAVSDIPLIGTIKDAIFNEQ
ncbi:Hypothetical predicted protein [Olea europaea subsp. europaea]|uniref:Laminin G domain-containing protein n=1 Tax=Olea europaea subsp. europaea TaxID=158383 RepID=A0A8S0VM08_OLEEU|nr:Hypothetical predicted protein [Olea europaea subsp. europaea]